jgi:predicted Zn-dependent peptidase
VEGLGGYLNAFTTEDHTCYYAKAGAPHFERVCDVLMDMYTESVFAKAEINREREVIREEILMYRDQPAQHAQELLTSTLWPKHPLGRPITGSVKTIANFQREDFVKFRERNYCGANTVATVAGQVPHEDAVALLRPVLEQLPPGRRPRFVRPAGHATGPDVSIFTHDTEQTHLAMGFHAWGRRDERRFPLKLLSVILGENMSSRLFQKLRERHGYCYSVNCGMVTLDDTGAFQISAGLDPSKLEKAIRLILHELTAIGDKGLSRAELRRAQDYTIGQTLMGLETTTNQLMWMGESMLGYGHILPPEEIEQRICNVTPDEVQGVARECLQRGRLGVAVVGPIKSADQLRGWLN